MKKNSLVEEYNKKFKEIIDTSQSLNEIGYMRLLIIQMICKK